MLGGKSATTETLCGTYFSFCDTSFKMASEHRSAHEYGDMSVSRSIGYFGTDQSIMPTPVGQVSENPPEVNGRGDSNEIFSGQKSKTGGSDGGQSVLDKKAMFDQVVSKQHVTASVVNDSGSFSARSSQGNPNHGQSLPSSSANTTMDGYSRQQQLSSQHLLSQRAGEKQARPQHNSLVVNKKTQPKLGSSGAGRKASPGSFSDSDSGSDIDDAGSHNPTGFSSYKHVPHPPSMPPVASYANEKDKFEMALNNSSAVKTFCDQTVPSAVSQKERFEMALRNTTAAPEVNGRDKFELALQSSTQSSHSGTKDKINGVQQRGNFEASTTSQIPGGHAGGIRADVVGSQLADGNGL